MTFHKTQQHSSVCVCVCSSDFSESELNHTITLIMFCSLKCHPGRHLPAARSTPATARPSLVRAPQSEVRLTPARFCGKRMEDTTHSCVRFPVFRRVVLCSNTVKVQLLPGSPSEERRSWTLVLISVSLCLHVFCYLVLTV